MYNVLFLCTGNSARSIIAESLMTHLGGDRFRGFSAGSHPKGQVHPLALAVLEKHQLPTAGLRSKSWNEFATLQSPQMHFVFTVCDNAANEVCPIWPGHPVTAHWGLPDPAAVTDAAEDQERAFRTTLRDLDARIKLFTSLQVDQLDRLSLAQQLNLIGTSTRAVEL